MSRQATHLAVHALTGTPVPVIEQQILETFLQALLPTMRKEVLRVDRVTLKETCEEAERQETLMEKEAPAAEACAIAGLKVCLYLPMRLLRRSI